MENKYNQAYEALYGTVICANKMIENIDTLKEHGILKGQLKVAANLMSIQCAKVIKTQFENNPKIVEVFDKENLLKHRLDDLTTAERLAVDSFIDDLMKLRENGITM